MTVSERLRQRLIIASTRFANEVADAFAEATGDRAASSTEDRPTRRRRTTTPRTVEASEADLAAGAEALAKRGIFVRKAG